MEDRSARDFHVRESRRLGYQLKYESPRACKMVNEDNGKDSRNEEVVRYMSNLPGFLKKDVKINEKAFSVGVLDWKLLEKWQHFHKRSIHHSSASSDLSSFSSTGGSSTQSSRAHSLSPAQKKLPYPTLQSHFNGTPFETESSTLQSLEEIKEKKRIQDPESFRRRHHYTIDEVYSRKQGMPICEPGKKYPQPRRSLNLIDTKKFGSNKSSHLSFPSADNFEASCNIPHSSPLEANPRHLHIEEIIPAVKDQVKINSPKPPTKTGPSNTTKVRNPSPTRRLSFSLSKVGAEEAGTSSSSLISSKANIKGRSSSPLRRLLDPLIGPARDSTSHSVKVKLDLNTCKNDDAEVPRCNSKLENVEALLQVAVRNGVPLFTFAVDNKNDILAATMRKSGSVKEEFSYLYSFFVVQEMKKKSGSWINHGRKDKGDSFVPNIVAQMKVTDAFKQKSLEHSISKEYVLFSHDTEMSEQNDELAAVVVKNLKKSSRHHGQTEDQISMTVLLPGGHHGQPIKGEPSSLVKRWQSGGSCDCGGWDLGCRMRVLTDNTQFRQKPHHSPKLLELFSQDGQDQKPMFSFSRFKDGIYAVEFNSSIKILQAFSISLSVLNCLKHVEFVETSRLKEKFSADFSLSETGKNQTEVPAFVSNPPLSPVGRV